ncbi:MAG: sigma-70 family RNA polymerase sigma factor [Proteobacteria bacterium]|nr:sigma-70 family RNA polymerase sigma factor [Pseudomonadota bacterium]
MDSDESLYIEVRKGSNMAFEHLYAKYERPLFGFILRRVGNRQDSEEIFHETMVAIFRGPAANLGKGAFAGWLYKVSLNLSLNRLRKRARESNALNTIAAQPAAIQSDKPDFFEKYSVKVEEAAQTLSEPLAQVYALRRDGKSYEEMATTLDLPLGTVKSRIHLMVKQLRKEVDP